VIPPQANAAFVWAMEAGLEVSTRPDDPQRPPVCLDETRTPCGADPRGPIPATPGQPARVDSDDERKGPAHLFMVLEPLLVSLWRRAHPGPR
jgi:hypothetical protein